LIALSILFASFLISADSGWCAGIRVENMANVELGDRAPSSERLFEGFENLMPFRVNDILLVSSLYDSFILREDGRLNELLIGESLELNLHHVPGITHVSSGEEAVEIARSQPRFNLIVTNLQVGDMDAAQLAHHVKAAGLDVPVVVLAYDHREIQNFLARNPVTNIDRIFLWQGNARILISIVNYIEDKRNVLHDTKAMTVPVLLLVEDDIRYYSLFLPVIYTEIIGQSRRLLNEALNVAHKLVRMRARPKILLCSNYEEAEREVLKYRDYLFGVISDVEFPRAGELNREAGFELAGMVRDTVPDVPIVLQSSRTEFMHRAHDKGYAFLQKRSPTLLGDLRNILTEEMGFGDFVFHLPDGKAEVARAGDLNALENLLHTVPEESLAYHGQHNHFSHWLMARTEFALAQKLRPRTVSDFGTLEDLRRDLIESIAEYRRDQSQALIGEFNPATFQPDEMFFLQIGGGSLGGKARGLAFIRHILRQRGISRSFAGVRVTVPPTLVLTTEVFDRFLDDNDLVDLAIHSDDDAEIERRFLQASFPIALLDNLLAFLEAVHYPLAVRSSSLLEDSQYQPFSGVYETFMLANCHADIQVRLEQLLEAIKLVYASTFSRHAKAYVRATPYRLEEEKMAVVVQKVVGAPHADRFYPDFSGVVRSRNFYPMGNITVADGFAAVALGLGRAVVTGGKSLTFSPRHPQHLVQFSSVEDVLANSQTEFWALELNHGSETSDPLSALREVSFDLKVAEGDGTLQMLASTYSLDNHAVYDGLSRPGARIVSFAPILKHGRFPLPQILDRLMTTGEAALGRPVEIEFAVRLPQADDEPADFGFLQLRPLVLSREGEDVRLVDVVPEKLVCQSSMVLGHGRIQDVYDVVVVDSHRFERARSRDVAHSVAHFNAHLCAENRPYLLIGVGRWGSTDPWLGIPVAWDQISGARVIVESGFDDFRVAPSQGSHFFQNLTAFQIGYFTVNPDAGEGFVDWQWLSNQPAVEEHDCVRHLRFDSPVVVMMNGKISRGMIFKPDITP
jgi:CheY-like chemotaxis protein